MKIRRWLSVDLERLGGFGIHVELVIQRANELMIHRYKIPRLHGTWSAQCRRCVQKDLRDLCRFRHEESVLSN